MIPYGRQWIDEDDIKAVVGVLKSDWLTQGPVVNILEKALAEYCGAKYAVAVSSGTAALHLTCLAAGIKDGDEVVTSPITFVASANCLLYCGGKSVFADIDKDTYNIDPAEIKKKITKKTRAIIPVHFAGLPCDMEAIKKIAEEYDLMIIEDACHALGAEYRIQNSGLRTNEEWIKVGSCSHSDMTVFSFHPVKHITTGEGGAVLTNNEKLYEKLLLFRNHGITKNPEKFTNKDLAFSHNPESLIHNPNPWYYEMQELGFNYRLTDIQCALGLSQLNKLDKFVAKRRDIASLYSEAFKKIECIKTPVELETKKSAYHLYVLQIDFEKIGKSRDRVMIELMEAGIGTQVHYIPVYMQPYYGNERNYKKQRCTVAEQYYSKALSMPLYPKMTDVEVTKVINSVKGCLNV
ncbi:MAG: UDP-4-amino-4,6-dideoxy-N-acetyl-beta-L-altrosamine transaminase [Deltaproteobacteria bacterium]|nr:UDP-4-amino-4,6-dideoxy-N-acetyl-beta-L-altrosamine transaminase [Deltaproteobacteria bacterium]